jgi:NADH-quinone oxidoreductase subunit N
MDRVFSVISGSAVFVLPEGVLVLAGSLLFLFGPFLRTAQRSRLRPYAVVGLASLVASFAAGTWESTVVGPDAASPFYRDAVAVFARNVNLFAAIVLVLVGWRQVPREHSAESHGCLLFIVAGTNLIGFANDLVTLFLALELVSIPTYVYLALNRSDLPGNEAATKYFMLSILSSAVFLYGLSFFYGLCGETNLAAIRSAVQFAGPPATPVILFVAMTFVVAGLAFRVTAVPFHFYAPDVFEGSRAATAALLAYLPKAAGFVALLRLLTIILPPQNKESATGLAHQAVIVLFVLAVATMFVGNLLALRQQNLQRLLAYSSIAHAGYMLVSLAAVRVGGWAVPEQALLFYLAVYAVMTTGLFAIIVHLDRPDCPVRTIGDLAGLGRVDPFLAFCAAVFLFSLTGLPPTAGFLGKLYILWAAWSEGSQAFAGLAALMAINAAIGAAYYMRIVGLMYLAPPGATTTQPSPSPSLVAVLLCLVPTLGLFLAPGVLWRLLAGVAS